MSGDPTGGNATGGPDIPVPTGPRGVFKPTVNLASDDVIGSELVDFGKTPQEIDAMNKLAEKRNLRFAPERGEESLMRSMDILSERDRLVGARGPDMFRRSPSSTLKRREGSGLTYDEYL